MVAVHHGRVAVLRHGGWTVPRCAGQNQCRHHGNRSGGRLAYRGGQENVVRIAGDDREGASTAPGTGHAAFGRHHGGKSGLRNRLRRHRQGVGPDCRIGRGNRVRKQDLQVHPCAASRFRDANVERRRIGVEDCGPPRAYAEQGQHLARLHGPPRRQGENGLRSDGKRHQSRNHFGFREIPRQNPVRRRFAGRDGFERRGRGFGFLREKRRDRRGVRHAGNRIRSCAASPTVFCIRMGQHPGGVRGRRGQAGAKRMQRDHRRRHVLQGIRLSRQPHHGVHQQVHGQWRHLLFVRRQLRESRHGQFRDLGGGFPRFGCFREQWRVPQFFRKTRRVFAANQIIRQQRRGGGQDRTAMVRSMGKIGQRLQSVFDSAERRESRQGKLHFDAKRPRRALRAD